MKSDSLTTARAERSVIFHTEDSTPSPAHTAAALRVAALIAYVGALTATASPVPTGVSVVTVAVAIPVVVLLLLLAETVTRGGRVK